MENFTTTRGTSSSFYSPLKPNGSYNGGDYYETYFTHSYRSNVARNSMRHTRR